MRDELLSFLRHSTGLMRYAARLQISRAPATPNAPRWSSIRKVPPAQKVNEYGWPGWRSSLSRKLWFTSRTRAQLLPTLVQVTCVLATIVSEVGLNEPPPPAIVILALAIGLQPGDGLGLGKGLGLALGDGLGLGEAQARELRIQRIRRGRNSVLVRSHRAFPIEPEHELFSAEPGQAAFGRFRGGLQGSGGVSPSLFLQNVRAGNGLD